MKVNWKKMKLSKEEKDIEKRLLRGEYRSATPEELQDIARAIKRRKKEAVLSLRINQQDLDVLKRQAKQLGVPYQSFISEILHRHA